MIQQRTPEWYDARKGRITASLVGAILGLSPHKTREDVMEQMIRGQVQEADNPALNYGIFHEPGAIVEFEMETALEVEPAPFVPYEDWLGASPDGYVSDGSLIEVKCPFRLRNGGKHISIEKQKHYYAQVQTQLFCTGYKKAYFFQWSPFSTMTEVVEYDEAFVEDMLVKLRDFWDEYIKTISG